MNPSLQIALLTYSTKPRGSVIHTLELAAALQQLGHRPCVFALDKDQQGFHRPTNFATCAVPAAPCTLDTDGLIQQRIGEFVAFFEQGFTPPQRTDRLNFDIYHAQDCLSANALAILRERREIRHFVRTVHHIENFRSPYLQACQEKSIYQPDRCLVVSQHWQQILQRDYGIAAHRVTNGVGDRFSPEPDGSEAAVRQRYGICGQPVYLTIGGIEPRKNSRRLLQAFCQVRQHQPQAQLVIAGGATLFDYQDYRAEFLAQADAYSLRTPSPGTSYPALVLPAVVSDRWLPALYRTADAFIFPSLREGWGLVALEALASGLPLLVSQGPPFDEFLSSATASLVDPENVEAIAQGMRALTEATPQRRFALRAAGLALAQQYRWQTSAQMHLDLYRQLG